MLGIRDIGVGYVCYVDLLCERGVFHTMFSATAFRIFLFCPEILLGLSFLWGSFLSEGVVGDSAALTFRWYSYVDAPPLPAPKRMMDPSREDRA